MSTSNSLASFERSATASPRRPSQGLLPECATKKCTSRSTNRHPPGLRPKCWLMSRRRRPLDSWPVAVGGSLSRINCRRILQDNGPLRTALETGPKKPVAPCVLKPIPHQALHAPDQREGADRVHVKTILAGMGLPDRLYQTIGMNATAGYPLSEDL